MIKPLIEGFQHFRHNFFGEDKVFFQRLTKRGQKPKIMSISCSDSRVDPAILFNTKPGEIFAVRNVANLVPPYKPDDSHHGVSAAIEFGVKDLEVAHIIVLGHAFCGGIQALCSQYKNEVRNIELPAKREFLKSWIEIAKPAMQTIDIDQPDDIVQHTAEQASIVNSLQNLRSFPWIKEKEDSGSLGLHGWWFDMENGALWAYDKQREGFRRLVPGKQD